MSETGTATHLMVIDPRVINSADPNSLNKVMQGAEEGGAEVFTLPFEGNKIAALEAELAGYDMPARTD